MDAIYKKCVAVTAHPESEVDVLPPTALVEALRSFASTDPAKLEACLCPRDSADFNASSHFVALDDLDFQLDDVKLYTPSASRAGDAHVGIAPAGVLRSPCAKESVDYTAPNRSKHERPRDASPDANSRSLAALIHTLMYRILYRTRVPIIMLSYVLDIGA